MKTFLNKNFLKSSKEFLSLNNHKYTVIVKYKSGESRKHENIENPWGYKKSIMSNVQVEDVIIVPQ